MEIADYEEQYVTEIASEPKEEVLLPLLHPWSHLEKYFLIKSKDDNNLTFSCQLCLPKAVQIKAHSTSLSNLKKHVERAHLPSWTAFQELIKANSMRGRSRASSSYSSGITSPTNKRMRQQSIPESLHSAAHNVSQSTVDERIVDLFVANMLPLQVVESKTFENFVKTLNPKKNVMSRRTLTRQIVDSHCVMKRFLIRLLEGVQWVATTADCWSAYKKIYIGLTVHWLDPKTRKRERAVLGCMRLKGRHTYDVLAQIMISIHYEFHIESKVVRTTTDNGSNFMKEFGDVSGSLHIETLDGAAVTEDTQSDDEECLFSEPTEEQNLGLQYISIHEPLCEQNVSESPLLPAHMRCAAHTFILIASKDAKEALQCSDFRKAYASAMGKASALWNIQSRSNTAADLILDQLENRLIMPNSTRWNSTFDAVMSLTTVLATKPSNLQRVMVQLKLTVFNECDINFFQEYVRVMSPVARALDMVQREEHAYLGTLLPIIGETVFKLKDQRSQGLVLCGALVNALLAGIEKRFNNIMHDEDCQMAAAFHPRFRLTWLQNYDGTRVEAVRTMMEAKVEVALRQHTVEQSSSSSGNDDGGDENFFVHMDREEAKSNEGSSKQAKTLIKNWLKKDLSKMQLTDAAFLNEQVLIDLFIKYNTAIPSSAAVERLFSMGKDIMRAKRSALSDKTFKVLAFMRGNMHLVNAS